MRLVLAFVLVLPFVLGYEDRLCPDNYVYTGDDTPVPMSDTSDRGYYYYEEIDRSPTYSCYRRIKEKTHWMAASQICQQDDAELVSFQDEKEMERVTRYFQPPHGEGHDLGEDKPKSYNDLFTSGMYFREIQDWAWTSANSTLRADMTVVNDDHSDTSDTVKDCLLFTMVKKNPVNPVDPEFPVVPPKEAYNKEQLPLLALSLHGGKQRSSHHEDSEFEPRLVAASCFTPRAFMCELRAQTVTYASWWVTNWVDVLLGFLLIVMFIALCISICAYTSPSSSSRSARRHVTSAPAARVEVIDLPPSYDSTVRIHKPVPPQETTTTTTTTTTTSVWGNVSNKSKQMWNKVYVYKPGRSSTAPANNQA